VITSRPAEELGLLVATGAAIVAVELSGAPVWAVAAAAVGAALTVRPTLGVVALVLLISMRSHAEQAELRAAETRPVTAEWITFTRDPVPLEFGWQGEAELAGERVRVSFSPGFGARLDDGAVGEAVEELPGQVDFDAIRLVGPIRQ